MDWPNNAQVQSILDFRGTRLKLIWDVLPSYSAVTYLDGTQYRHRLRMMEKMVVWDLFRAMNASAPRMLLLFLLRI
jgi:hypothetical protein